MKLPRKPRKKTKNIQTWIRQRISPYDFGVKTKAGKPAHFLVLDAPSAFEAVRQRAIDAVAGGCLHRRGDHVVLAGAVGEALLEQRFIVQQLLQVRLWGVVRLVGRWELLSR